MSLYNETHDESQERRPFRTSSIYDLTPTTPLDLRNPTELASDAREGAAATNQNFYRSSTSIVTSESGFSFTTANSFEQNSLHPAPSEQQNIGSQSSNFSDDLTPIVGPTAKFDAETPHFDEYGSNNLEENRSRDSFNFVEHSFDGAQKGLGISTFPVTDSSIKERTEPEPDHTARNDALKRLSTLEPTSSSHQSPDKGSRKLERKSILEAYTKQPIELPDEGNTTAELLSHSNSDGNGFADSTGSHDNTYMRDLQGSSFYDTSLDRKHTFKRSSELDLDGNNLAYLFIIAIHSFNSQSLKNKEDIEICLSFEKHDVAFVHTVDESGWGEVTLIRNQKRGWVPFNYFSDTVKAKKDLKEGQNPNFDSRVPLTKLFSSSAKFILHPQDYQLPAGSGMSFSLDYINGIRDGVKYLLEATDCVSRSNELVRSRPIVKRARKLLLADWYNLMIKADSYKYTTDSNKLKILENLVFQVLRRGYTFYNTWNFEKQTFDKEKEFGLVEPPSDSHEYDKEKRFPHRVRRATTTAQGLASLSEVPWAVERLNEVHELLFSYVGLIIGRLDMIEHNPAGCEVLESIVHQVIVLLRELLYISKSCSSIMQAKFPHMRSHETGLDQSLDPLLSLVSELVSCIKVFVTQTMNEEADSRIQNNKEFVIKDEEYAYTDEGKHLIIITAKMTGLIGNSIQECNRYLSIIGDFRLGDDRSYPDFEAAKITPTDFIRKCSAGLTKRIPIDAAQLQLPEKKKPTTSHPYSKKIYRYSTIRSGGEGASLTTLGSQFLHDMGPDNAPFVEDTVIDKYGIKEDDIEVSKLNIDNHRDVINNRNKIQTEIEYDKEGKLVGASYRALAFLLTDELEPPNDFLIATFLSSFRSFSSPEDLIEELVARFDVNDKSLEYERGLNNGQYSSRSSRLKNRRRMVCKIFQTWMESYWDYSHDYHALATIANFINEGISIYLPIEARNLIEITAKLATNLFHPKGRDNSLKDQILQQPLVIPSRNSMISIESSTSSKRSTIISVDEGIIENYELTKLPSAQTNSISIPLPLLNVGTSSLLSRRNVNDLERIVKMYHSIMETTRLPCLTLNTDRTIDTFTPEAMLKNWSILVKSASTNNSFRDLVHNDLNLVELNPLEVAKQLSLIESTLYLAVGPGELMNQNFIPKKKHLSASPDVERIIDFANLLSNYVIESIVASKLTLKVRASRLTAWLNIALSALYFRNFNTVATIMTALQSHILSRVELVWENISEKYLELYKYLSKIIHPDKNYSIYRLKLRELATGFSIPESGGNRSPIPIVPFFALFLQDLTFIHEGIHDFRDPSSFRPNKLINIDKFFRTTKIIALMQYFQVPYEMEEKPNFLGSKRDSIFNFAGNANIDTTRIKPVPLLQEFILYEFWRVNTLYKGDSDRGYKLSLELASRNDN